MPRIRTVKPEFWHDEKLAPLSPITRLAFLGLISMADDAGRVLDNVKVVDAFVFPNTTDSVAKSLTLLSQIGVIERGKSASGQSVIQIVGWGKHQKVEKANLKSCLPSIYRAVGEASGKDRGSVGEESSNHTNDLRPTTYDQTTDDPSAPASPTPDEWFHLAWTAYPKRPNNSKADARKAFLARLKEGVDGGAVVDGVVRYADYVRAAGVEPKYVKMAATFFGPGRHWESDYEYTPPPSPLDAEYARLAAEAADVGRMSA